MKFCFTFCHKVKLCMTTLKPDEARSSCIWGPGLFGAEPCWSFTFLICGVLSQSGHVPLLPVLLPHTLSPDSGTDTVTLPLGTLGVAGSGERRSDYRAFLEPLMSISLALGRSNTIKALHVGRGKRRVWWSLEKKPEAYVTINTSMTPTQFTLWIFISKIFKKSNHTNIILKC